MAAMQAAQRLVCTPFASQPGGSTGRRRQPALVAIAQQQPTEPDASRRAVLLLAGAVVVQVAEAPRPVEAAPAAKQRPMTSGDWSSPGLGAAEDETAPKFFKTPSGAAVQVLSEGAGPEAATGDLVLLDYVLRRGNGYFIYSTVEGVSFQPRDLPVGPVVFKLGDGTLLPGLEEGLLGARPGAKRRILVPPQLGYKAYPSGQPQMPTFATQRQVTNNATQGMLFEVQVLRVGGKQR